MATGGEDDVEYESDPEEVKRSLMMRRRRAASDDEDGEEDGRPEQEKEREGPDLVTRIHSDESDGQGGAADYDDEDEEEYYEEEEEDTFNEEDELIGDEEFHGRDVGNEDARDRINEEKKPPVAGISESASEDLGEASLGGQINQEGEKKVVEPYAVPTAGAFYMHDDRFRENVGGRRRRPFGGRNVWESKDESRWGHDKFEEMSMQERHYEDRRRNSRGRSRGRGRGRGLDRGYGRGNRSRDFENHSKAVAATNNNSNYRAPGPTVVRGRGSRRYEHSVRKSNQGPPSQNKPIMKSGDKPQHDNPAETRATASTLESDSAPTRKNTFGSGLSSASPPFYPSASSNKEGGLSQKKDAQAGKLIRNNQSSAVNDNFTGARSNSSLRGKNVAISTDMDKLSVDDLATEFSGKPFSLIQAASYGSPSIGSSQPSKARAHGAGAAPTAGQMVYQPALPQGQIHKAYTHPRTHTTQRSTVSNRLQASVKQLGHPADGSQDSSPPKTANSVNPYDMGDAEIPSDSSKSKGTLIAKGKDGIQGNGRGSFMYGGAHVMGTGGPMGVGHSDQNFPAAPAFLPVMQFGSQHPGGVGFPAVGMAFPGYVAQPQLGSGNSEMTWLPVLAGAAGAFGATYGSPYIAIDGSYHALPSGHTSVAGSTSREDSIDKPDNELKPSQGAEPVIEEQGQRQNKARRYSEMNFGQ